MVQGNIPITKHILNVITFFLLVCSRFISRQYQTRCLNSKFSFNQSAVKEIYDLKINNSKRSPLIAKENDITSIILIFCFHKNLSLQKIEHQMN